MESNSFQVSKWHELGNNGMAPMQAELCLATCQRPLPPRDQGKRATGGDNIDRAQPSPWPRHRSAGIEAAGTLRSHDKTKQYPGLLPYTLDTLLTSFLFCNVFYICTLRSGQFPGVICVAQEIIMSWTWCPFVWIVVLSTSAFIYKVIRYVHCNHRWQHGCRGHPQEFFWIGIVPLLFNILLEWGV